MHCFHGKRYIQFRLVVLERMLRNWQRRLNEKAMKFMIMWMYEVPDWKVSIVYNAVNFHQWDGWTDPGVVRRKYSIGPMDPVVLFAGRMVYQKGPGGWGETVEPT